MRSRVMSGDNDAGLRAAIIVAGKRPFLRATARAFAVSRAACGDVASAKEIVRVKGASRGWCTDSTLALARDLCGSVDQLMIECEGGAGLHVEVVAGGKADAAAAIERMIRKGDIASAIAHARVVSHDAVFDALSRVGACDRSGCYIRMLREVIELVGGDERARLAIVDAAVAIGSGEILVRTDNKEDERQKRLRALYTAYKRRPEGCRSARRPPRTEEYKTLDILSWGDSAPAVEVMKC